MAIKKFNRKRYESEAESDSDALSKTQQKNESLAIKNFGLELAELSVKKLSELPLSEVTLKSLLDYQKITTNLAKKRHIMFIGKCLRNEDEQAIRGVLNGETSLHLKQEAEQVSNNSDNEIIDQLIEGGDAYIDELLSNNPVLKRQTLRQILRNINNAKTPQKKQLAINKIKSYLKDSSQSHQE